jgi:hypothetical protein
MTCVHGSNQECLVCKYPETTDCYFDVKKKLLHYIRNNPKPSEHGFVTALNSYLQLEEDYENTRTRNPRA